MKTFRIPPLFDHHSHFSLYSVLSATPSLENVTRPRDAYRIIQKSADKPITIITGWNSSCYNLTPGDLGESHPVIVLNLSLHGMVINKPAEEYLAPEYNDFVLNRLDPAWTEKNLPGILAMIVRLAPVPDDTLSSFAMHLESSGIAAIDDMLLPGPGWLDSTRALPVTVGYWADRNVYEALPPAEKKKVKGVKFFTDGALGTRTAALTRPYLSGGKGMLLFTDEELKAGLYEYMRDGRPAAVHAIGDRAVDQAVKTVHLLRRERGCNGPVRIEHAQFISGEAARMARNAGIILSMQPNFSNDSSMYTDRLPAGFAALNNPFRMLIDDAGFVPGEDLIFGSDGMPHGIQPALQSALFPPFPGQAITLPEFQAGYCLPGSEPGWCVRISGSRVECSALP